MTDPYVPDDYDIFLESWVPSELSVHANQRHNLNDPLIESRLTADSSGEATVRRAVNIRGTVKDTSDEEWKVRAFYFIAEHQAQWSSEFREMALDRGVPAAKFDCFSQAMATEWIDGKATRQNSAVMRSIRKSVRDHDAEYHKLNLDRFTLFPIGNDATALFTPQEMQVVFETNEFLLQERLTDYLDKVGHPFQSTVADITVRRGVHLNEVPTVRSEPSELSSFSLGLVAPEQFAQTSTSRTRRQGKPCLFSANLPAVQSRVVAFSGFIWGMTLDQMELVVAPPITSTDVIKDGEAGGIIDLSFD